MDSVTLALDVMGGDNGPRIAVPAIKRALHVYRDLNLLIFGEEKIVDVNIRRLRMKIEKEPSSPQHLVTVWGMGYKWRTDV